MWSWHTGGCFASDGEAGAQAETIWRLRRAIPKARAEILAALDDLRHLERAVQFARISGKLPQYRQASPPPLPRPQTHVPIPSGIPHGAKRGVPRGTSGRFTVATTAATSATATTTATSTATSATSANPDQPLSPTTSTSQQSQAEGAA